MHSLKALEILDLSNNKLSSLDALKPLTSLGLKHIVLEGNPIKNYKDQVWDMFSQLESLDRMTKDGQELDLEADSDDGVSDEEDEYESDSLVLDEESESQSSVDGLSDFDSAEEEESDELSEDVGVKRKVSEDEDVVVKKSKTQ